MGVPRVACEMLSGQSGCGLKAHLRVQLWPAHTGLNVCFSDTHSTFSSSATSFGNTFPSALYISLDYRQKIWPFHLWEYKVLLWRSSINLILLPFSKVISDSPARTLTFVCHVPALSLDKKGSSNIYLRTKAYVVNFKSSAVLNSLLNFIF
jgi:hypothetical protein